jgi:2-polyprenyl-3-methyl-5-hydroxy-6-metoxy-1,4-benzoquinol methylase
VTDDLLARVFDDRVTCEGGALRFRGREVPVRNGIPRFTPDVSYSTGNFSRLRERHARLQLDSANGTRDRLDTILTRTNWPREFFRGKLVLECGCGAGPDTEVLLALGATVVSVDLTGVDVCRANIGRHPESRIVQASIDDLPFREHAFDVVWCHRVLQHTPSPARTLDHILRFAREDGAVFVHSYARTFAQMFHWKYALRPLTRRMDPQTLYAWVEACAPTLYRFTSALNRVRPRRLAALLARIAHRVVPVRNYRFVPQFAGKDDAYLIEFAIHDTFDSLSPRYDSPLSARAFREIAGRRLARAFEVVEAPDVTLLRTIPKPAG